MTKEQKGKQDFSRRWQGHFCLRPQALKNLASGVCLVINAIRDVADSLEPAADLKMKPEYEEYDPDEANRTLIGMKNRKIRGAKVLRVG